MKKFLIVFILMLFMHAVVYAKMKHSNKFSLRWVEFTGDTEQIFFSKGNHLISYDYLIGYDFLKLGFSLGFMRKKSFLIGIDSGRESGEKMVLTLLPMEAYLECSPFEKQKWYVQPFLGAGYQSYFMWLKENTERVNNVKHGYALKGGIRFSLREHTSMGSKELFDIDNIFLDVFASYRPIAGSGVDLSAWDYGIALGLDFL
ncbi:MAG TPA: hypothetical protein PKC21_00155 [Oligoflexia bacterium]|nr:hypothetical protein [Oligoflexia bacterium]HMR23738.1 hypothetical protein [Oligoflexia bacterium]